MTEKQKDYTNSPMAAALAAALQAKFEGHSEKECLAIIDKALPASHPANQPRYRCRDCLDRGTLVVWRADFVLAVKQGRMVLSDLTRAHTYLVACYCTEQAAQKKRLPVYATSAFCRFDDLGIEYDRQLLREWIEEQSVGVNWAG